MDPVRVNPLPSFDGIYGQWRDNPEGFWADAAKSLVWSRDYDRVFDASSGPHGRWFVGGKLNSCWNALDRHVLAGNGERLALIYDSAMTGEVRRYSYAELLALVERVAGMLQASGVGLGDRVVIYMPMVPEAVATMLACARLGAIHSVVFGGFAARELALRIEDAKPKVIVSASCGLEPGRVVAYKPLLDQAIAMAGHKPDVCIILQRPQLRAEVAAPRDKDWEDALAAAPAAGCVEVDATHPAYILYTSGTTGKPKGVVRDTGGHAVALTWSMKHVYDIRPGEAFWAASDIGWVVGHSYIVYGPLLIGATSILYEGKPVGTPDAAAYWRVIDQHNVRTAFTAPTALRAIRREDPHGEGTRRHDVSRLRSLFLAGERADPDTVRWAQELLQIPIVDHWWQTESGWPIAANALGIEALSTKPGSSSRPLPGYDVRILDDSGDELTAGRSGAIALKLPLPPGNSPTLWNDDDGYVQAYLTAYPGYYATGDGGYLDDDHYLWVMGRIDDVLNIAGHRLSSGAIEEVIAGHPDIAECAVIPVPDAVKGEVPLALIVLKGSRIGAEETIEAQIIEKVRLEIGPVAALKKVVAVQRLPKTRSGKILRSTMRFIAAGKAYTIPATIEDPDALSEVAEVLGDSI